MHFIDHLFILLLFVALPIQSAFRMRRDLHKIRSGKVLGPVKFYSESIVSEWLALAALAVAWYALGRPAADLGFVAPGGIGYYVGLLLLVPFCVLLIHSWRSAIRMTDDEKATQVAKLGDLAHVLPRTNRHYRYFFTASITAGVVEEIVYRGFVIWYLVQFMPLWGAVITSSVFFGLGHSYQGANGALRAGLLGLALAVFYVVTGSIWLPIISHALLDIFQGRMLLEFLRDQRLGAPVQEARARASV